MPEKYDYHNQKQEKDPLRISIRDKSQAKYHSEEETELEIEIIEKNKPKLNTQKDNLITVDLTGFASPQKVQANPELPVLNISLDQRGRKESTGKDKRNETKERDNSKKPLKTFQEKPVYNFGSVDEYDTNRTKENENETAEFARTNLQNMNTIDLYYQNNIRQNMIKEKYKAPNPRQNFGNTRFTSISESLGNTGFEGTIEEKLRQTNDLINDAITTLELAHSTQVIDEARIHILKSEKDRLQKITEFISPQRENTAETPIYYSLVEEAAGYEQETENLVKNRASMKTRAKEKELNNTLKNKYQEILNRSTEEQVQDTRKQRSRSNGRKNKSRKIGSEKGKNMEVK